MTRRPAPLPAHALAAYLEDEVTPSEAAAIEAHVRDSATTRRQLDQLDELRRTLARVPDDVVGSSPEAIAALWRAIDAPQPRRGSRWTRRAWLTAGAGACAALALLLIVRGGSGAPTPDEFRAKAATAVVDDRWVHIEVLRVEPDGVARPLPGRGEMRGGDRLVFRYASGGPDPFAYLMVFAVDAAKEIHWYYPAYEAAGADPRSVAIRIDSRAAALPDAIEHDLPSGPLVFYGVFTHAPLRVLDVERRIAAALARQGWNPDQPPRLPFDGSGQHLVSATVTR